MTVCRLQVSVTYPKRPIAQREAARIVRLGLAACGQVIGPIGSVYRWKGKIVKNTEFLCLFKTTKKIYPFLERAVREKHPYEVPEIAAIPIVGGSRAYLDWIKKAVR